ncbi:MAG: hypothetical protein MJ181_10015 [Treponema sp.]|nr:hypothetical protein [Treponema sp.]
MYKRKGTPTAEQKSKTQFRRTKIWNDFRQTMKEYQNGKDFITQGKLPKGWNLHHANLNPEYYQHLEPSDFFCLGNQCHDFIHWLYRYYRKDKKVLERIKIVLDRMLELSEVKQ